MLAALATAANSAAQTLHPAAATIRKLPELGVFERVGIGVGDDFQSSYFRTTTLNRELRRGIAEFSIPSATILSATLVLRETRATVAPPLPPDVHNLISYTPADLAVTTDDYDRAGTAVGTFSTDNNDPTQTFTFDVTALAVAAAGGTLGFRAQLAVDPDYSGFGFLGSGFRVSLAIVTPPPLAIGFDFKPDPLNLSSRGRWVTGYLEPAVPLAAGDIDIASIRLNGTVSVDPAAPTAVGDPNGNGLPDLIVKFKREAVELTVSVGENVAMTLTGMLDGQPFTGTDYIRVRRGRTSAPVAGSHFPAGTLEQVRWETPAGVTVESVSLLFSTDGGGTWSAITRGQPNTGSYDWAVPNLPTDQAMVAVLTESADEGGTFVDGMLGVSEAFSIGAPVGVGPPGQGQFELAVRGPTPNPALDGRLRVEITLRDGSPAQLELVDVTGRALISRQLGTLGPGRHAVDLSSGGALGPGIYFLRLTQDGRKVRARAALLR